MLEFLKINISEKDTFTNSSEKIFLKPERIYLISTKVQKIPEDKKGSGMITRIVTPGKWKENFSAKEKSVMKEIMDDTLKKLEY